MLSSDDSKSYLLSVLAISELRILTRNRHRMVQMCTNLKLSLSRLITILFPELPSTVWSANQKSCYSMFLEFPTAKDIANANILRLTNVPSANSHGRYGREKALRICELARNIIGFDSRAAGFELRQTICLIKRLQEKIDVLDKEIRNIMRKIASPILSIPDVVYIENFQNPD